MKKKVTPEYLKAALALTGIQVDEEIADLVIQLSKRIEILGGQFTLKDAVDIKLENQRKYLKLRLEEQKSKENPKENG